jgi:sulfite exporter TauE/SafE
LTRYGVKSGVLPCSMLQAAQAERALAAAEALALGPWARTR